ncbi:MAG: DUF1080 domain-containing protein [Cellulophaga sp.]
MKKISTTIGVFLVMLLTVNTGLAQMNRTLETKVADILAQLPTKNLSHSDKLMEEIIALNEEGILQFTNMLVPLGTGNDTQARYAIESLAIYSGGRDSIISNGIVENTLLKALKTKTNAEVKTFLMERLMHCATNESIQSLQSYLGDTELFNPALATLESIGTIDASQVVLNALKNADAAKKPSFVSALGNLNYVPAIADLENLAITETGFLQQKALHALAQIASPSSASVMENAVKKSNFTKDASEAVLAYILYGNNLLKKGKVSASSAVAKALLKNCTSISQLHFRSAGIHLLRDSQELASTKTLLKEVRHKDNKYRGAVFNAASHKLKREEVYKWVKVYKKLSVDGKAQLLHFLRKRKETGVYEQCISAAVSDKNEKVRIAGIKALAFQNKKRAIPVLLKSLTKATSSKEYNAIKGSLLRVAEFSDSAILANSLGELSDEGKAVIVGVLGQRKATSQFDVVISLLNTGNEALKATVFSNLSSLVTSENLSVLIDILNKEGNDSNIKNIQNAIVHVLDSSEKEYSEIILKRYESMQDKGKMLVVLPALNTKEALKTVKNSLSTGNAKEKRDALNALSNWRTNDALPYLFKEASTATDATIRSIAFKSYLTQIGKSSYPDDQKLLLVKKLMPFSKTLVEKKQLLQSARGIKTFLSLVFVSQYLKTDGLVATASNAAISIALPTPGKKNGLSGEIVRKIISNSISNLTGADSQYIKIDVKEFLDNMSSEKGFVSIFNGTDFSGWEGLVKNPIARGKMSKRTLVREQEKANKQMMADWFINDGVIGFKGEGYNNICTIKDYGDFEMLVDWKITNGGDSGIYLRGAPQVQIWDIANVHVGAEVGSGGLYNNQKNNSKPTQVADNPVNEWNTFRIKMVGERVTVHLNGVLVTDNVVLENYWDRKNAIFPKEAIELQAHGEDLGFRNIYVREIASGDDLLSEAEQKNGFKSLFNGKDLNHWIGNKTDYVVEENVISVQPKQGGHGNLYTAEEFSNFIFRFEFKLTSGANNGLGIHAPLEGDAAYMAKELQILDDTAPIYANLKEYQYHGSVYGVMSAKRGFLKPVGQWNTEEVIVKGESIKIILNGIVILEGNFKEASSNGTLDGQDHPGLKRKSGHIAFLGHGSELWFRNIRVKDLSK